MPRYENLPELEGVNAGGTSAVGEFIKLAIALVVFCVILVVAITFGMRFLAPHIPFRYEVSLVEGLAKKFDADAPSPTRQYLQELTDSLAAHMSVPEDMPLTVHVDSSNTPNAFATLGGHLIVTQGLLDLVDSENALAMVVAHEIAHIKHRDVITTLGSGVVISIVMGILFGNSNLTAISNTSGLLTHLTFSRAQENTADQAALDALTQYYGHTNGAETFFKKILETSWGNSAPPEILSTHPDTPKRIARIETDSARHPNTQPAPLPDFVKKTPPSSSTGTRPAE